MRNHWGRVKCEARTVHHNGKSSLKALKPNRGSTKYACMDGWMNVGVYVFIRVYVCICIFLHFYLYACLHVYLYAFLCTCVYHKMLI